MEDRPRLDQAHVPAVVTFATKPQLAAAMIERATAADVPFAWVAADTVYGVGAIEMALRRAGKGYVLGVSGASQFNSWGTVPIRAGTAAAIAGELDEGDWQRVSAGEGTKGARLYDWAYCPLADLDAADNDGPATGLWTRGLLIRRAIVDGDLRFFSTLGPGRHRHCHAGQGRGAALGHRGQLRDGQKRTRARSQREPLLARLAPACLAGRAGLRHDGGRPACRQHGSAPKKTGTGDQAHVELIR